MAVINPAGSFDPYDPAMREDTPLKYARLARGGCPIRHVTNRFDFHLISDPAYIQQVMLRDTSLWTVEHGPTAVEQPEEIKTPMTRDDESHLWIRKIIQRGFSPGELARIRPLIERLSDELIDAMLASPDREGDLAAELAMPITVRLMCVLLGAPEADWKIYKQWADNFFYATLNDPDFSHEKSMEQVGQVARSLFPVIAARRAELAMRGLQPSLELVGKELPDDFLSRFICDRLGDRPLEDNEILGLMMAIILGGSETTMALIGNLMLRLLEAPERWAQVKADPKLYDAAVEESLRLDPPVLGMLRAARQDIVVDGVCIPKDRKAFYNISSVNRNPSLFEAPDEFRLDRPRSVMSKHVSFSGGMHLCLGAPLVRLEVPIILGRLVARMPGLTLAGPVERARGFNVWGLTRLPVRW